MKRITWTIGTATVALAVSFSSPAYAQSTQSQLDPQRAAALIARAEQLQKRTELSEKARLYEDAAALMPAQDVRAASWFFIAGSIANTLGRYEHAMHLLEHSADLSARRGAVTEAADAYVAALFAALKAGDRAAARRFIDRAISLTGSPAMSEVDRTRILRRISQPAAQLGTPSPIIGASPRGQDR